MFSYSEAKEAILEARRIGLLKDGIGSERWTKHFYFLNGVLEGRFFLSNIQLVSICKFSILENFLDGQRKNYERYVKDKYESTRV